ncbi:hypothetical protein ACV334_35490, partial [Pseudomonas aeruginosa]
EVHGRAGVDPASQGFLDGASLPVDAQDPVRALPRALDAVRESAALEKNLHKVTKEGTGQP